LPARRPRSERRAPGGPHTVTALAGDLVGFEIVLTAPDPGDGPARPGPGLPPIGTAWRDRAVRADYFASTARLADGVGAWAMLAARLGDRGVNRAFADRWWHGAVRGADVLFPPGESMAVGYWGSRKISTDFSRISTLRTLPVTVMGNSSVMCT
jgi:hypothetical protein